MSFRKSGDFAAFVTILEEGRQRLKMRILAYCLMNNHWHMVLWPRKAGRSVKSLFIVDQQHARAAAQRMNTARASGRAISTRACPEKLVSYS